MNNLKTSTKVLIALAGAAIILGAVLFFTMPEPWAEQLREHQALIANGDFSELHKGEGYHDFSRADHYHKSPGHFGGFIIVALIVIFAFRYKKIHGRRNHSNAILDELYAEEKITEEEYRRRKAVIEEERQS